MHSRAVVPHGTGWSGRKRGQADRSASRQGTIPPFHTRVWVLLAEVRDRISFVVTKNAYTSLCESTGEGCFGQREGAPSMRSASATSVVDPVAVSTRSRHLCPFVAPELLRISTTNFSGNSRRRPWDRTGTSMPRPTSLLALVPRKWWYAISR